MDARHSDNNDLAWNTYKENEPAGRKALSVTRLNNNMTMV